MARLNALACQLLIRVPSEDEIDFSKCRIALFPKGYKNPDISPKAHSANEIDDAMVGNLPITSIGVQYWFNRLSLCLQQVAMT